MQAPTTAEILTEAFQTYSKDGRTSQNSDLGAEPALLVVKCFLSLPTQTESHADIAASTDENKLLTCTYMSPL